jgi:hypothetical protein
MNGAIGSLDWNAIYLTCFGVGLVLSLFAFFGGFMYFHAGHFHLRAHRIAGKGHGNHPSPINGFTVVVFLCWFGGAGYLMHQAHVFGASLVLFFSALSGLAGSSLLGWFLIRVLLPQERTLESSDTEITGVIGKLSGAIPAGGVGEVLYSQNGARRSAIVRADDGSQIPRGAEVIVMRYERGIAYVRRWDEFQHGLLVDGPTDARANALEKESSAE